MRALAAVSILLLYVYADYYEEYSDKKARQYVVVSAGAYADNPQQCLTLALPDDDYTVRTAVVTSCDDKNNTCALFTAVSLKRQRIIVSFRGTVGESQMKTEMLESLAPSIDWYGYGLIDRYFYNAHEALWKYIVPTLNESSSSHFEVQFTGYSLGGALATLAAVRTHAEKLRRNDQIKLLTFGEPRVGNSIFAKNIDRIVNDAHRVVHKGDIVPHLPPCRDSPKDHKGCDAGDLRRMYHHGTEVWYNNDMREQSDYIACTRSNEDAICSDGLGKWTGKDHLNYFGHDIGAFGQSNCTSDVRKETSTRMSLLLPVVSLAVLLLSVF